ncbi:hypothetical protein DCM91_11890 [Chitinophaga costaii]|nr:hypothetical protein DCM91_11890 [Chitinophaga costaii]
MISLRSLGIHLLVYTACTLLMVAADICVIGAKVIPLPPSKGNKCSGATMPDFKGFMLMQDSSKMEAASMQSI